MATEAPTLKYVAMTVSTAQGRVFRNNRGLFQTLDGKRKVRAGLEAPGASDLIGFMPVTITPDMVGKTVAVFMALECKEPNWKKPSDPHEIEQENFIRVVTESGGIGGFLTNAKQFPKMLDAWKKKIGWTSK